MRLDVFMQELSYEEITQQKAYDVLRLLSKWVQLLSEWVQLLSKWVQLLSKWVQLRSKWCSC